jgi:hypothetical protein
MSIRKQTPADRARILAEAKRELDACLTELSCLKEERIQRLVERTKAAAGRIIGIARTLLLGHPWR